ncbi:MAG: M48 family metallopeptidase [Methylococcaceae bacterium]|nr:M48 family metallopeptidase [Methylococcaceae bacterium]
MTELPFSYSIRRSQRAVKVRIVVKPGRVEVVAPAKTKDASIQQFVEAQQSWVVQALAKMAEKMQQHKTLAPAHYGQGVTIPYQGEFFSLTTKPTPLKRIKIEFIDAFIVHLPDTLDPNNCSDAIKAAFINWLKKQTQIEVEQLVDQHAGKYRLYPRNITIKRQKSRWGSCGIHNDISINWLLSLAPKQILEYVVVHELCHIREKNHSRQFWALVSEHLPDYQQHRLWLKKNGARLMMGI